MKCLRVEEKSFVARNKMNSSRRRFWYGISLIPMVIPLYTSFFFLMLGWETRKGMTLKRVSEMKLES